MNLQLSEISMKPIHIFNDIFGLLTLISPQKAYVRFRDKEMGKSINVRALVYNREKPVQGHSILVVAA